MPSRSFSSLSVVFHPPPPPISCPTPAAYVRRPSFAPVPRKNIAGSRIGWHTAKERLEVPCYQPSLRRGVADLSTPGGGVAYKYKVHRLCIMSMLMGVCTFGWFGFSFGGRGMCETKGSAGPRSCLWHGPGTFSALERREKGSWS